MGQARSGADQASTPADAEKVSYSEHIAPLLKKYCVTCHGGPKPKGDISLSFRDENEVAAKARADRKFWERVARNIRSGEMPPGSRPKPDDRERDLLVGWIDRDLLALDCTSGRDPGRVTVRRLNRAEYANTIRDLLYLDEFRADDDFPADDRGYGFDNNGDLLTLSPILVEAYLKAAEEAVTAAFRDRQAKAKLLRPAQGFREDFADRQAKVRKVIEAFAPRAYRRPVSKDEVDRLMHFAALSFAHENESFDKAYSLCMRAALLSPAFLFRIERDPDPDGKGRAGLINEFELASRLSYFLWSSMPDDELFQLARDKKLRESLPAQVRRMLADPKATAVTEQFAGQWLEFRGLDKVTRDPELFPDFDAALRRAMKTETSLFFEAIVKEDRSIMDFLDADFTFVNERLARHYGIPGVSGEEFRRVRLDPERRGGVLTHASVLTLTSMTTRTSPVKRGLWILDNIFNTPPPPPPPDVPALPDDGKKITGTLRQALAKHRADPNCVSCHERMDPYGLALENYDAVGAWRTRDGGEPIDPSGTLVTGEKFKGPREFRSILASKKTEFRRGLAGKMLVFALGRGLEYHDACALDNICAAVARSGDRFSSLVLAIVESYPFQYRKGKAGVK
jgi:hypothetical protein